ncbi:O-antigen ligase family protein [Rhodoferax ferrireducens]|uniref:O-antigen ligase family protein n=1 Tax=Rhodoferax ferrireducens TaxID=192843 RepID=UPI000E0D7493|nr:O-antigen ligase family protein [Rhodoferax ferrireducens]
MTRLATLRLLRLKEVSTPTFLIGLLAACYIAVLPMSNTIALRNVVLLALSMCLAWQFLKARPPAVKWVLPVVLWVSYILFFPFIAVSPAIALENLLGQWGRGVLAMLVGAGVATIFYSKDKGAVFYLGLASAFSILVHLCLFGLKAWTTSSIPWGYWGRETHHADLGYAAGQAIVLLAAATIAGHRPLRPLAVALMFACLLSTALAHSRAGLAFGLIGGVLAFGCAYLVRADSRRINLLAGLLGLTLVGLAVLAVAVKEDARWQNMASQLVAGFQGDAIQIQCEGTSSIESKIISQYGSGEQAQQIISSVRDGDGARMVVLRAGLALALKHPWGSDGSRHSFQKLLMEECATPAIQMAHTHNGWLDTVLALGWIGAALYMWALLFFLKQGLTYLRRERQLNEWAIVLVALSTFWILRGFTDSIFRDHMMEMQGFLLAYASVALNLQTRVTFQQCKP